MYQKKNIFVVTIGSAVYFGSWLPILLIGGPRVYGTWHMVMTGVLQHLGMAENVTDHRLNTRTVMMNPISRFIYLNMNYHVEHHMFPMVPFYNLTQLSAALKDQLPEPCKGLAGVFGEIIPAVIRQQKEPGYFVRKIVPGLPEQPVAENAAATAV